MTHEADGIDKSMELYYDARLAHESGSYGRAIELLTASSVLSDHFKTQELLGVCYEKLGLAEEALEAFEKAYSLNSGSSKTACLLAESLLNSGQMDRAKEVVELVLAKHADYGPAMRILEKLSK